MHLLLNIIILVPHFRLENPSLNNFACCATCVNLLKITKRSSLLCPLSFCFNLVRNKRGKASFHRNFHQDSKEEKEEEENIQQRITQNTRIEKIFFFLCLTGVEHGITSPHRRFRSLHTKRNTIEMDKYSVEFPKHEWSHRLSLRSSRRSHQVNRK